MNAADAAWQEWADDIPGDPEDYADVKGIWMAGYRRALEDAADDFERSFDNKANVAAMLRARAAEISNG
jgi:hypothetical protein